MNFIKVLLVILLIGISNLNAQNFSDPWPKGKIKTIKLSIYENHFESGKQPISTVEAKFDIDRQITELINNDLKNVYYQKQDWIRSPSDSTIISSLYYQNGKVFHKSICYLDEKGQQKYEINYNLEDDLEEKYIYFYNELGQQSKILKYNEQGNLYGESSFDYDENQNRIRDKHTHFSNSIFNNERIYIFDSQNNLIEKRYYGALETLERKENYVYDIDNLLTEKVTEFTGGDSPEYYSYQYISFDAVGNYTKRLVFNNKEKTGTPKRTEIWEIAYY